MEKNGRSRVRFLKEDVVKHQGDVLELMDKRMGDGERFFRSLIDIGRKCVSDSPKERPEMVSVLIEFEKVLF